MNIRNRFFGLGIWRNTGGSIRLKCKKMPHASIRLVESGPYLYKQEGD